MKGSRILYLWILLLPGCHSSGMLYYTDLYCLIYIIIYYNIILYYINIYIHLCCSWCLRRQRMGEASQPEKEKPEKHQAPSSCTQHWHEWVLFIVRDHIFIAGSCYGILGCLGCGCSNGKSHPYHPSYYIGKSLPGPNSASGGPCEGWLTNALPLDGNYFRFWIVRRARWESYGIIIDL